MLYLFLTLLCLLLAGFFYFFRTTTLGDKLGAKEPDTIRKYREINLPIFNRLTYFKRLTKDASYLNIETGRLTMVALIFALFGFAVSTFLFRSVFFAALAGAILFFTMPKIYLLHTAGKYRESISAQLSGALLSMTSALRAGKTLVDSVRVAAEDTPAPLGTELKKVHDSVHHGGEELGAALEKMLVRTGNHYIVEKLVLAIALTRQTGGNIAGALEGVASMIENEKYTQEFAKSHSSHGKMVAIVFNLIVLSVTLNMTRVMPGAYEEFFFSDFQGRLILFGCIALIVGSWFVIYRMLTTNFDV